MSSNVTGTGLKYLIAHDFSRIDVDSPQFGDEGASLIPRFRHLRMLGISRSARLTDKGLSDILKSPTLSTIQLRWMNLPPNTGKVISTSKTIRSVNLGHSDGLRLTDLRHLASNPRINTLRIAATKFGDSWVNEIIKMKLNELDINETPLTDAGLQKLAQIKTLTKVKLTIGQGITEQGVGDLRQRLPRCLVVEN